MIALGILVISIIGMISVITYTTQANEVNRENMAAMRAAEAKIDEMQQYKTEEIFERYSAMPSSQWTLAGLHNLQNVNNTVPTLGAQPGGTITIAFPVNGTNLAESGTFPGETAVEAIAQDLNINGTVGDTNVNADYVLLPVKITVAWTGVKGPRTLVYKHMFLKKT